MACQLVKGYFMPWGLEIVFIAGTYLHFLYCCLLKVFFVLSLRVRVELGVMTTKISKTVASLPDAV